MSDYSFMFVGFFIIFFGRNIFILRIMIFRFIEFKIRWLEI